MIAALQIDTDLTLDAIDLPDDPELRSRSIATRLSGCPDSARYHREALMWVHGNSSKELPPNLLATALASAWRRMDVGASYFLRGRVIVTGDHDGETVGLPKDLASHAHEIADIIADRAAAWRTTPPASNEAAWTEILQEAFTRIAPTNATAS